MVQKRALLEDSRALRDPLLEEVRRFYEENQDGIETSRRRHRYFYGYLENVLKARVPAGQRVLDIGCGSGHLLSVLKPSRGVGIDVAATAVEGMWSVAGTSGIFQSSPLERHFRDMQVLKQHAFYAEQRYETVGRVYLGLPPQFAAIEL